VQASQALDIRAPILEIIPLNQKKIISLFTLQANMTETISLLFLLASLKEITSLFLQVDQREVIFLLLPAESVPLTIKTLEIKEPLEAVISLPNSTMSNKFFKVFF